MAQNGKPELESLHKRLAATRRLLAAVLAGGLLLTAGLGYCAVYFRKRCNGFEIKLDGITIALRDFHAGAGGPPTGASTATTAPTPSAGSGSTAATNPALASEVPSAGWTPPTPPGGLPLPVDLAPLLAPLGGEIGNLPRPLFDELDLYERGDHVYYENASYYFRSQGAYAGAHCLEIQLEDGANSGRVIVEPRFLKLGAGDVVSLAFRKSRASSRLWMGLITPQGKAIVAHEHPDGNGPGRLALAGSAGWRELELPIKDLAAAQGITFEGRALAVFFGLTHATAGDSLFVDRVWTGPRAVAGLPETTGTVMLAGRVTGPTGGVTVTLVRGGSVTSTVPTSSAFAFRGLPAGAVVELWAERDGRRSFSSLGDEIHVATDVTDAHILTEDLAGQRTAVPVKPEWSNYGGPGVEKYDTKFPPHKPMFYTGVIANPLEYSNILVANRFGAFDRDHRFEDLDQRRRILILGDCQLEGIQTDLGQRVGPRLESVLRRRHGRDLEVFTLAHSNAHPAAIWSMYEKLGKLFKPDLVLIDANAPSVVQMEPRMLKNLTGWEPDHSAYGSMVFGPDGKLKYVPGDPNYPVFAGKPAFAPIGGVSPNWVMHVKEEDFAPETKELVRIFKAVTARYVTDARGYGARVAVYTGARAASYPQPQVFGGKRASQAQFVDNMRRWIEEAGATPLDISTALAGKHPHFEKAHFWKMDSHPTPTGHYWMAEALADQLIASGLVP